MYNSDIPHTTLLHDMPKIVKAFIQVYSCLVLTLFLWNSITSIRFPYGIDYGEAPLMDQARRILNRAVLYKPEINQPPYIISNYPPAYPSIVAVTNSIFRIPIFQAGRIISFIFSLLSGYIIGLFTFHLTQNKWLGVFSTALFLGQPYVLFWSTLARVDVMALALSLLGLWILYRYRDSMVGIIVATLCLLSSVFTKQTYLLAAPLAGLIWLWTINRKRALLFILLFALSGLLIFGMINALTAGGFYANIIMSNINQFNALHALSVGKQLFIIWPVILIVAAVLMALTVYTKFSSNLNDQFQLLKQPFIFYGLFFYTLGAVISAFAIGKVGSNVNYLLELMAACAIWCGIAWRVIFDQKKTIQWVFGGLILVQSIWMMTNSFVLYQQKTQLLIEKQQVEESLLLKIQDASQRGTILSDDYMDLIVLAGQPIYYQPFEYGELFLAGQWNPTGFIDQIVQKNFPLIIVGGDTLNKDCCWPEPVIDALEKNYRSEIDGNVLLLTPVQ